MLNATYAAAAVLVLLLGVGLIQRAEHPGGSFWEQRRTIVEVDENPRLEDALASITYGVTRVADLHALGLRSTRVDRIDPDEELHVFVRRRVERNERRFLGLVQTGSGRSESRTHAALVVRDGYVVARRGQQ